ncbi:MAG: hypothetical protein EBZ48_12435 [Proteobacteria bacterium]|nr:hypothetical protein [Pseudomonadota bacterium]
MVVTGTLEADGCYTSKAVVNNRLQYEHDRSTITWVEGFWRLQVGERTWEVRSEERYPPSHSWDDLVVMQRELLVWEPPTIPDAVPISSTADCVVGERVRLLPLAQAEGPTRMSSATWTEACATHCGKEGTIIRIDRDETIEVCFFESGRKLWLAPGSCTKVASPPQEHIGIMVRDAGGRGAKLNGLYAPDGEHNGRPIYRQEGGCGVVYCGPDDRWRISPGSLGGWFYSHNGEPLPPEGLWTTEGFNGGNVEPPPTVERVPHVPRARVINHHMHDDTSDDSSDSSDEEDAVPGHFPDRIVVEGAGGVGERTNGIYEQRGMFKKRPKYYQEDGEGIIYFRERWKINFRDDISGWYYSYPGEDRSPPTGIRWTTEGYDDGDALPPPLVSVAM